MIEVLFAVSGFCLLLGVVYPICAIIVYPLYVAFGGEQKFFDYMKKL